MITYSKILQIASVADQLASKKTWKLLSPFFPGKLPDEMVGPKPQTTETVF